MSFLDSNTEPVFDSLVFFFKIEPMTTTPSSLSSSRRFFLCMTGTDWFGSIGAILFLPTAIMVASEEEEIEELLERAAADVFADDNNNVLCFSFFTHATSFGADRKNKDGDDDCCDTIISFFSFLLLSVNNNNAGTVAKEIPSSSLVPFFVALFKSGALLVKGDAADVNDDDDDEDTDGDKDDEKEEEEEEEEEKGETIALGPLSSFVN